MNANKTMPLCVDLDGTLLLTDSLIESLVQLLKTSPWLILWLPVWLLRGRARFKSEVARRVHLDVGGWPLHAAVLEFVEAEKKLGRKIVLATAADRLIAAAVQERLQLFDEILASDGETNLSGQAKADALAQRFGARNFDYLGNSTSDLPVWRAAHAAGVAGDDAGLVARAKQSTPVEQVFVRPRVRLMDWARALRVHQWAKNLLLFVPVISAHQWTDPVRFGFVILGAAAFSLCASSVYLLNDLLDLESDRRHPSKRHRPLASGKIPLMAGLLMVAPLLAASAVMAACVGGKFAAVFGAYYVVTLSYSLRLKQFALLDVLALAGLYGLRIMAGGVAASVPVSDWLIMFSLFLFLSLAFAKRSTEIRTVRNSAASKLEGRGYAGGDAELISSMGVGSGYLSVLVLAMYISHPSVTALYSRPQVLWLACPVLLYWISRVWLLVHRGAMNDDPVWFALRDRQSGVMVLLLAIIGFAAGPI